MAPREWSKLNEITPLTSSVFRSTASICGLTLTSILTSCIAQLILIIISCVAPHRNANLHDTLASSAAAALLPSIAQRERNFSSERIEIILVMSNNISASSLMQQVEASLH